MTTSTGFYDRRLLAALAARRDFTAFKMLAWKPYEHAPHLQLIDDKLTQVARYIETGGAEGIGNLLIELPPRHGKSQTVARLFPAWLLGRNPNLRIILACYGASLAVKHSRFVRGLIRDTRFREVFPGVRLSDDSAAKDAWDLAAPYEGGLDAVGKGGSLTGKGASLVITDDLVKGRAEAESALQRENDWQWVQDDLLTRKEPGAAHVAIGTRWHVDDVHGRFKTAEGDLWHVLRLPALSEDGDILDRPPGGALWPERWPASELDAIQQRMGEYSFVSLYQQRPIARGAEVFDTSAIDIIDFVPALLKCVRFYDLAVTAKKHSDYTAGVKLGITADGDIIILHVYRVQKKAPDVQDDIAQNAAMDGTDVHIRLEAEKAGIMQLDYLLRDSRLHMHTIDAKAPQGDKFTRAQPFAARVKAGKVKMVRGEWNRAFLDELSIFPQGAHDDMVDAVSGAYEYLNPRSSWIFDFVTG